MMDIQRSVLAFAHAKVPDVINSRMDGGSGDGRHLGGPTP